MNALSYDTFSKSRGVESLRNCTIVIDNTLLLRKKGPQCLQAFRQLRKSCKLYMLSDYKERLFRLLESEKYQCFFSDQMAQTAIDAWALLKDLPISKVSNNQSAYRLFKKYSGKKVFATGNETEALRHILNDRKGDILLVTDYGIYHIPDKQFPQFIRHFGQMKANAFYSVPNPADCHKYYGLDGTEYPIDGILSADGSEAVLFQSGRDVLKCYYDRVSIQKANKLSWLTGLQNQKPGFAWPKVLLSDTPEGGVVGFVMDKANFECTMDDLLCGYKLSDFDRWQLAVNFTAQVLYLYLFDIQIGDYNRDNFGIRDDLSIFFMDVDSYIVGHIGTQVKSRSRICYPADYNRKADVIAADYYYLHATIFYLLTGGRWPYYFPEPGEGGTYILHTRRTHHPIDEQIRKTMPPLMRGYFSKILNAQELGDPFELYEYLLRVEDQYKAGLVEHDSNINPELWFETDKDEPRKRPGFWSRVR